MNDFLIFQAFACFIVWSIAGIIITVIILTKD
jgi:hypothetical protein